MKFKKIEYHQVHSHFTYDFSDEEIIETFGSLERFKEIASHMNDNDWSEPEGKAPTDEEHDNFHELFASYDYDRDDDWFTDRKGGYTVGYEVVDESDEQDNSCWTDIPTTADIVTPYTNGQKEYKIQIFSRGLEAGIGEITKAQYEYWSERDEGLDDALNQDFDYDEAETPEEARFEYYYNDYSEQGFVAGPTLDSSHITITCDGEVLYDMEFNEFLQEVHGEDDWLDIVEETEEIYINSLKPGYYVYWAHGGKGEYFVGTLTLENFDPKLLRFEKTDMEGMDVITTVIYDTNTYVDDEGGSWSGKWSDYSLHEVK